MIRLNLGVGVHLVHRNRAPRLQSTAFAAATDHQRCGFPRDAAVRAQAPGGADDVDEAGFIFQAHERLHEPWSYRRIRQALSAGENADRFLVWPRGTAAGVSIASAGRKLGRWCGLCAGVLIA